MFKSAGVLALRRNLHLPLRVTSTGLTCPLYPIARSITSEAPIWRVGELNKSSQKARNGGSASNLNKSPTTSSSSKHRPRKSFSELFHEQIMSSVRDFHKPIDRQRFHAQYITTPTADTPGTTILLHFNSKRYLFGRVAEGTQRACIERGAALKKARNIFLTGETKWAHNGGLLGMILTMADFQVETNEEEQNTLGQIRIHGGPKLWHSVACARRFIFRTGMPMRVCEAKPDAWNPSQLPDFIDENIMLWALPVRRRVRRNSSPVKPHARSMDSGVVDQEQTLRQKTVHNMFDSDWRKDKLSEAIFHEVNLPAMIWVRDPETKALSATFCTTMTDAPHINPDQKVLVRMPWPAALVADLPPADNISSSVSMSYIAKGRPQRGAFIAQKAKELGVKPGPLYGLLASGQNVTTEDGRIVTPEEVMEPVTPSQGMAVLDVPDVDYLPDLRHKLDSLKDGQVSDLHAFLWILGTDVSKSPDFLDLKSRFPSVKHVIASPENSSNYLSMTSSAASATRLNQIRPEMFPIPLHDNLVQATVDLDHDSVLAERGLILDLAPRFEVNKGEIPPYLDIKAVVDAMSPETKALVPAYSSSTQPSESQFPDVSVATLGTGSAMPSKYRNVSANLLHIPSLGYFLFDAGEDTLGQLKRLYNPEQLEDILCNLHMIWISHLHADHHLGTVSVLVARREAVRKRREIGHSIDHNLYLVSERNMPDYIEDYKSVELNDAVMLHCLNSELKDTTGNPLNVRDTTMPIKTLDTTRVSHCHGAQAISVTFTNGFKISYSGDCRPSASFAVIGQDSDILIHEATFDDGMEGDAQAKRHCTIGEALGVAHAMKAKNVILTHFSQRYQKLPTLTDVRFPGQLKFEEAEDSNDPMEPLEDNVETTSTEPRITNGITSDIDSAMTKDRQPPKLLKQTSLQEAAQQMSICVAFDLMHVTIPQIQDMYHYYPAIEHMFEVEHQKSEAKREVQRLANEALLDARSQKAAAKRKAGEAKPAKTKGKKDKQNGTTRPQMPSPLNQKNPSKLAPEDKILAMSQEAKDSRSLQDADHNDRRSMHKKRRLTNPQT